MRIYFSPENPEKWDYSIISMIHYLGYSVARSADEPFDIAYMWDDQTYVNPSPEILKIAQKKIVLNIKCIDISKVKVEQVMKELFGYGSLVDPQSYVGKCIKKYDENGRGGGEVIYCPDASQGVDDGQIYQRFIETNPGGPQLEYRIPIVMGVIPMVFEVLKDDPETVEGKLIKNQRMKSIHPKEVSSVFSKDEQEKILQFCQAIGFDIGELDVLRCAETDRMYIIDANKTPTYFSMYNLYWKPSEKRKAIATVSIKWEEQLKSVKILSECV